MPYEHETDRCFASAIGPSGLAREEFDRVLADTAPALDALRRAHDGRTMPLLALPARRDDLDPARRVAQRLAREAADVVVLGTGGSSLGGQTLYALCDQGFGPKGGGARVRFHDNVDPATFEALLAALDPARTAVVAISKSGTTAETLAQLLVLLAWARQGAGGAAGGRFVAITEAKPSPLRRLAEAHSMTVLDHDPGIGGRYSVLSNVGLLPAMIGGLDAQRVRLGASEVLKATLAARDPSESAPAVGAALSVALHRYKGAGTTVLMPYADRLERFGLWFRQLWAESLGKNGAGTTPVRAVGTVDQHSQLQLYLDGPRDKMYTLVLTGCAGEGPEIDGSLGADPDLAYLAGKKLGALMDAEGRATAETLARHGRPVRVIRIDRLEERTLGALLMHFMLETIVAARLLGVDPFDQPAVEEGKEIARAALAGLAPATSS
jgi:glucose-6-phosphate isomerase